MIVAINLRRLLAGSLTRVLALLAAWLAACSGVPAPAVLQPVVAGSGRPPAPTPAGSTDYRVDPTRSELRVLVYRGGALAALGHNHVIVDDSMSGWIRAGTRVNDSSFYLQLAPADFLVDPGDARAAEGPDFAEPVTDEARAGTRRNMQGAALLNVERFALVLIQGFVAQDAPPDRHSAPRATLRLTIAGQTRMLSEPFTFERSATVLRVRADFRLRQSALGLTPYAVLMGGLQVEDEMELKLDVVAVADQVPAPR